MKKNFSILITTLLVTTLLTSCNTFTKNKITIKNTGKSYITSVNREFEVELYIKSTTGYKWDIVYFDQSIINLQKSTYKKEDDSLGSGGYKKFYFKAVCKGETLLKIKYHKPWDKTAPIKDFKIDIKVI